MKPNELLHPEKRRPSKAYLANKLREAVFTWREQGYPGISLTTKRLLQFWFSGDHIVDNRPFEFWFCQREAVETLIYVYEVVKKRNFIDMVRDFGTGRIQEYDLTYDQYPLYAFKMATSSGKTYVMALAIVWSYFNHKREDKDDYTSKFLLIAGDKNVIYDRLVRDFKDGKIFRELPFIPPEWQEDFDLKVILKEDPIHVIPENVLFVTNIQQLEEKKNKKEEVEEYVDEIYVLPPVHNVSDIYHENRIREVLSTCPNVMILKDEAHHIYKLEKAWKKILLRLNKNLISRYGKGINTEFDFSATPKTEGGVLFPWIIVDFPLKEAIEMDIVKLPLKGIIKDVSEVPSTKVVVRYRPWIDAGIRRWREYKEALKLLSKKPIIFFQCSDNKAADEIFSYVNSVVPDLKGKVLLIHTDSTGGVKKADLPEARKFARNIDEPDPGKNPYEAIVSTLMLNEGWDVKNVNVIVGLRSYTSKRRVLPEQVIGRGLRKMFPEAGVNKKKSINVLDVIGPPGLIDILEELESQEGIEIAEFDTEKPPELTTIFVVKNKLDKDIEIPILSPRISIGEFHIGEAEFDNLPPLKIPLEDKVLEMEYIAVDMLTGMEVIKRKWNLPVPQDPKSVIAYYSHKILTQLSIGGAFANFHPIVKRYVIEKLFTEKVDLEDPRVLYGLSSIGVQEKLIVLFVNTLRDKTFIKRKPTKKSVIKLSKTSAFVWSKLVYPAKKCIFNYVPCDSNYEVDFAEFLDNAEDVEAFTKIVTKNGFYIEYISEENHLRFYYPDFVVKLKNGDYWIIETKGLVDSEVSHKDKRAKQWCKDTTSLTGENWSYMRVNQKDFERYRFKNVKELFYAHKR